MRLTTAILLAVLPALPAAAATDLSDPADPWLTSQTGVTTDVPAPFEPLAVDGATVSCWGRDYTLAGPLPAQITSQAEALLAAPMRVVLQAGGEEHVLSGGEAALGLQRPDRVEFTTQAAAGGLAVSTSCWLEYDGLMQVNLTVAGDATVDRLAMEIPIRPEVALFLHEYAQWGTTEYLAVGQEVGWIRETPWQACTWIGDHYRGLTFITEHPGDLMGPTESQIQYEHTADAVVLRVNLIGEPTAVEGEIAWTLGLQASPGRPLPPTWHGRHVGNSGPFTAEGAQELAERGQTVALVWNSATEYFSYPSPSDPEVLRTAVAAWHERGISAVVYITLSGTGPSPVHERHRDEWMMSIEDGEPFFGGEPNERGFEGFSSTCPNSSYTDWLIWAVDRAMEDYDLDGVYIDNAGPYYCSNPLHGCGGDRGSTYPYFACRDLHKRLWNVVHGRKPDTGIIWEHNSRNSNSLNLTFCDVYSDGEHFRIKSNGTPEQITPLFLDITGTGRQWGSQPCFLPSALNLREEYTDWLLTRTLPYGNVLMAIPTWLDFSRQSRVMQARRDFGLGGEPVEWFTPEATPPWLPVTPEELLVGAYRRADNRVMLTVGNPTAEKLALRMDPRPAAAELGGEVRVTDALTGAECPPLGPNLVLVVPADSFRVVLIEPAPAP